MIHHKYTQEQFEYLKNNISGRSINELTALFNEHFQLNLGVNQVRGFTKRHKLKNGLDARFQKGHAPIEKLNTDKPPTRPKERHRPVNSKPVGFETINNEGYVVVKIAEPNKWKSKHILIWEAANGPTPENHVIIFGDGNRQNLELDNLILITRQQLIIMNRNHLIQDDPELTKAGVNIAKVYEKLYEKSSTFKKK